MSCSGALCLCFHLDSRQPLQTWQVFLLLNFRSLSCLLQVTDSTAVITMLSQTSQSYTATTIYDSGPTLKSLNDSDSQALRRHPWNLPGSEYSIRELQFPVNSSTPFNPTPPTLTSIVSMVHPDQCENTRLSIRYTFDRLQVLVMDDRLYMRC